MGDRIRGFHRNDSGQILPLVFFFALAFFTGVVLVINTGSSSLKYQLFDMKNQAALAGGVVERIGETQGVLTHKYLSKGKEVKTKYEQPIPNHQANVRTISSTGPSIAMSALMTSLFIRGVNCTQG